MNIYEIVVESISQGWVKADLFDQEITYNFTLGSISDLSKRQISHSDTISLTRTGKNDSIFGINVLNPDLLAQRLNSKFRYRSLVEDSSFKEGYLIINKITSSTIEILLTDSSIGLLDEWGSQTLREFYTNLGDLVDSDYKSQISDLISFTIPTTSVKLGTVTNVPNKTFPIVSFPNTLNSIGKEFNQNKDETLPVRFDNSLNVFQTRPLWNVRALLELACQKYGYTPNFLTGVDTDLMESEYIVGDGGYSSEVPALVARYIQNSVTRYAWRSSTSRVDYVIESNSGLVPDDYGYVAPDIPLPPFNVSDSYNSKKCIIPLNVAGGLDGDVIVQVTIPSYYEGVTSYASAIAVWKHATIANQTVYLELTTNPLIEGTDVGNFIQYSFDKSELGSAPANAGEFLGVIFRYTIFNYNRPSTLSESLITESYTPGSGISYDENLQYSAGTYNLFQEAPKSNLKEVISALLQRYGLKLDIDTSNSQVNFFSYQDILDKITSKDWSDWSEYFIEWKEEDSNFGEDFGRINTVSLKDPYRGNSFNKILEGQGSNSKYSPIKEVPNKLFKDISSIVTINTALTTTPTKYLEFENTGLGLVRKNGTVSGLYQCKVDTSTSTALDPIPYIQYSSFVSLPEAVDVWFNLVGTKTIKTGIFLLPARVVRKLDLSQPIFCKYHVYIIDEIREYRNSEEPVEVSLIRI